ncbi:MAG: HlyD family efflux transporter periplasmic adaptor subunit [Bacteroidetes bacterium]|nr:HlyD family efflux transporter periplasmic adaptor subunit [Bacteroidota bacterium]
MPALKKYFLLAWLCFISIALFSCKSNNTNANAEEVSDTVTPVTITTTRDTILEDSMILNATATFLQKWIVRANATGYIQNAHIILNSNVNQGQSLFTIKTKEAVSLGNTINQLDSSFQFSGINTIYSNKTGFVSELNHQIGDYVQDGDQLAVITDTRSFVFLLEVPYELRPFIINKKTLKITLPDNEQLIGYISGDMHSIDPSSQTMKVILRVFPNHPIPENLSGKVILLKNDARQVSVLPKEAVLSNEMQDEFWVMKLINDSIAIKIPVTKGVESGGFIEIVSPHFVASDKIILTGNYGLDDSSKVTLLKP